MGRPEPYSKVQERIIDTPTPIEVTSGAAIGCTIVAPKGPKLARITNDQQFLQTYTLDGKVPRNAHISFLNAYYMSFFAELIVARSMNSDAIGGLAIYASSLNADATLSSKKIYLKDGVELTNYYTLQIPTLPQTVAMGPEEYTNDYSKAYWGVVIDEVLYYGGDLEKVLADVKANGALVDISHVNSVACDLLIDETSVKTYTAQVTDYIASELNKGDEFVAVASGTSIQIFCDDFTSLTANKVELPNEEGVRELTDVTVGAKDKDDNVLTLEFSFSGPHPYEDTGSTVPAGAVRVLTVTCKVAGSVNANDCKIKLSKTRNLTVEDKKSIVFEMTLDEDTYLMSFDKSAVDSSGINCFIENFNSDSEDFKYELKVEDNDYSNFRFSSYGPIEFGEGFIDEKSSASITYLKSALNVLDEQELYRIRYLAPVGITSLPYIKAYAALGARRYWFAPEDIPYDRTNYKAISAYTNQIPDDYNNYVAGPFDKNTGLTGWMVYIAASTLYWERVMTNRRARAEFAPVYDVDTGSFAYSSPIKLLKKDQREKLISLNLPVNYVIYDEVKKLYYMNDNWTHYSNSENVAGEEQNVRMHHMISLDVQEIMKSFKAKINNARYRRLAWESIDNYFKNNLMNQEWKPDDYLITIDETNNTPDIIKARKMKVRIQVRYYNSTKYIDVKELRLDVVIRHFIFGEMLETLVRS